MSVAVWHFLICLENILLWTENVEIFFFFNTIQNLYHILFQLPTVSNKEIGPFLYQNLIHHSSQLHGDNKGVYKTSLYNNYRNLIECTCLLLCGTYVKNNYKETKNNLSRLCLNRLYLKI